MHLDDDAMELFNPSDYIVGAITGRVILLIHWWRYSEQIWLIGIEEVGAE